MRLLHTMLQVSNLERSLDFYCNVLGMKLLRKKDVPSAEFTLAFVGYGDESDDPVLELNYNWGTSQKNPGLGTGYGHIAIGVDDIYSTCEKIRSWGSKFIREPGPGKYVPMVFAFVEDPDGCQVELIQLGTETA